MSFTSSGIIVIDKPQGLTSHDVVAKVRKKLGTKKVGHAGTLDPMATGVLVLGINQATRLLDFIVFGTKEYEAVVRLGQATITDDAEGEIVSATDATHISDDEIQYAFAKYRGRFLQLPSKVSAKKIDGKRAHALVREGVEFELTAKEIEVFELEVQGINRTQNFVDVNIRVKCSAGTYIRSIARDVGDDLEVGGHLTSLRRTLVAPFSLKEAQDLESDLTLIDLFTATTSVLPQFEVSEQIAKEITFGKPLDASIVPASGISALTFENKVMAIVDKASANEISYRVVMTTNIED
ncbi:MAG: tRNA pseudouridine synthase [Actinomycetota bacterium]|jgi:tRNA pseudouridine55 synthase